MVDNNITHSLPVASVVLPWSESSLSQHSRPINRGGFRPTQTFSNRAVRVCLCVRVGTHVNSLLLQILQLDGATLLLDISINLQCYKRYFYARQIRLILQIRKEPMIRSMVSLENHIHLFVG